jgi:Ca2+-binding EF-hand superfamily protein|tara:strand:+ start:434 stop:655 length:222 start_codon:yes stop_codon:yes gene_type:complete
MGLVTDIKHDAGNDFDAIELFRTFKKYDRNQNGTLDFGEYILCMEMCDLDLMKHEIVTMTLNADLNGDGEIDF